MSTLAELGIGVGETVRFTAIPYSPTDKTLTLEEYVQWHNAEAVTWEGQILRIEEDRVYVIPVNDARGPFRRVHNLETGEVYMPRLQTIKGKLSLAPLHTNEQFVLALNRNWHGFLPVTSVE